MTTSTQPGGFIGDPTEAFTPPAASGCCGGAPADSATAATSPAGCCGSTEATAAGQCCTPAARDEAIVSGAGCCG